MLNRDRIIMATDQNLFHTMVASRGPDDVGLDVALLPVIKQETEEIEEYAESEPEDFDALILNPLKKESTSERPRSQANVSRAGICKGAEYYIKKETSAPNLGQTITPGTSQHPYRIMVPLVVRLDYGVKKSTEKSTDKKETEKSTYKKETEKSTDKKEAEKSTDKKETGKTSRRKASKRTDSIYACKLCDYKTIKKYHFQRHGCTHTGVGSEPGSNKCPKCSFQCRLKENLARHVLLHNDYRPYACQKCTFTCKQKSILKRHDQRRHAEELLFICKECPYKANAKSCLTNHMYAHTGNWPFSCQECAYKCTRRQHLVRHMLKHGNDR